MNKTLKKNKLKIFLIFDFVMVLVFVLLFNKDTMPDKLHEVAGFVMLGMATLHLVLHPSYIVKMTKLAFSKDSKLSKKARFSYIINFLLFIILILMIVSSISISKEVFNNSGTSFMKNFHKTLAALMILIVGIHLGLHHKMIASKLKFNKII
jgi:cytochrome b561